MSIKVRNENRELEEIYSKDEVYSKSETDNIQTATVTVNEDSGNGKVDITFTRTGNVVFVRIDITIFANKKSVMIVEQLNSIIPDFAKTNSIKGTLINDFISTGGATATDDDYHLVLSNFAKASITAFENGNYLLLVNAMEGTLQEKDATRTITGCYITDAN